MSRGYSRYDALTAILAGTLTVAGIVTFAPSPLLAKSSQEIAQLAIQVTVQINSTSGGGSGFIIAKQGTTYTVLTCNHVVDDSQSSYQIRTHTGQDYPITNILLLQTNNNQPDLAVVTFNSTESYPAVTLGDSDRSVIGSEIFVFGYPGNRFHRKFGANRNERVFSRVCHQPSR